MGRGMSVKNLRGGECQIVVLKNEKVNFIKKILR